MAGIAAYGAYVPYYRLQRAAIGAALGSGGGKGTRAVASYDEDATSMGVEAARIAMKAANGIAPQAVFFATSTPPYLDKTNAAAIHAALGMPAATGAYDLIGSPRSAVAAQKMGGTSPAPALTVLADVRTGLPGGADERDGGDAAVAFLFTGTMYDDRALAEIVGRGTATNEFLDRWRVPGEETSHVWEERFGEHAYVPLAEIAINDALKMAGVTPSELDYVIVSGLHGRAVRRVAGSIGARPEAIVDDLTTVIGNPGAAQFGILLADVLDRAEPNQVILSVNLSDGADAAVLRTTDELAAYRDPPRCRRFASRSPRVATTSATRPSSRGAASCSASHRAVPIPNVPPRRRRCAPNPGSTASSARSARRAARGTFRRHACASVAVPWTRWIPSGSPTSRPRSPRTRSTGWRSRCRRPWSSV